MNAITTRLLTQLLKDIEFWEPIRQDRLLVGYKLSLKYIYSQLRLGRETLFYDEVYFPRTQRLMRLIKKMNIVTDSFGWQEMEVGVNVIYKIWYPVDTEWQECLSDAFQPYFDAIYNNEHWGCEEPTEEEMLALGVRPDSLQAFQEKLF